MNGIIELAGGEGHERLVEAEAEPVVYVLVVVADLGIAEVEAEMLLALGVVFEQTGLLQRAGFVPHEPAARRAIDLADDLKAEAGFADAPGGDGGEHLHELLRGREPQEVLEFVEEIALPDERVPDGITGNAAGGPLVHGFGWNGSCAHELETGEGSGVKAEETLRCKSSKPGCTRQRRSFRAESPKRPRPWRGWPGWPRTVQ